MKVLATVLLSSLLLSCATPEKQIVYVTKEIDRPVYQIPEFTIPDRPILPIEHLVESDKNDHNIIGKAYVISIKALRTYNQQLLNILKGIKEKGEN